LSEEKALMDGWRDSSKIFSDAMVKAEPVAGALTGTVDSMSGVIEAITEHNQNQSQAADALRGLSQQFETMVADTSESFRTIQLSLESLNVTSNSIHDRNQSNLALTRDHLEAYKTDLGDAMNSWEEVLDHELKRLEDFAKNQLTMFSAHLSGENEKWQQDINQALSGYLRGFNSELGGALTSYQEAISTAVQNFTNVISQLGDTIETLDLAGVQEVATALVAKQKAK